MNLFSFFFSIWNVRKLNGTRVLLRNHFMAVLVSMKFSKISYGANGKNSENLIQISAPINL